MSPHTHHNTTAIQPSPTMPNRHHTHATTYGTPHNPPSTTPTTHPPSGNACPGIRNTTEPTHTTLTDAANPTHPHAPIYESRHIGQQTLAKHHQPSWPVSAGHRRPHQSTPVNTDDQRRSNQRRHQLISTTIPFGASLWNTLRYTSRRIYTLHVEALYWSFHGRTKYTYHTSM